MGLTDWWEIVAIDSCSIQQTKVKQHTRVTSCGTVVSLPQQATLGWYIEKELHCGTSE